jgi:hypothetical protein
MRGKGMIYFRTFPLNAAGKFDVFIQVANYVSNEQAIVNNNAQRRLNDMLRESIKLSYPDANVLPIKWGYWTTRYQTGGIWVTKSTFLSPDQYNTLSAIARNEWKKWKNTLTESDF